jgi:hypothetical protein
MSIVEKVPTMSDDHLANLLVNARRMQTTGTAPQQATANEVVSAAEAETAIRRVAHLAALAAKRAAAPKKPTKKSLAAAAAAAAAAEAEDEDEDVKEDETVD